MENEISVQIAYAVQDLIEKTLHHHLRDDHALLVRLAGPMMLDDVPKIVLGVREHQPNTPVRVREEHSL